MADKTIVISFNWSNSSDSWLNNRTLDCYDPDRNLTRNSSCYDDYDYYGEHLDNGDIIFYYILWYIVTPIIFSLIIALGLLGNVLVIYVIMSRIKMQTATNYLLLNLAVSDIAFLVICVPITAYKYSAMTYPFGDIMCKLISYVMYVTSYVTVYTLVAVSLLRYITVVHSVRTVKFRSKQNIAICNVAIWVTILLVNIPSALIHKVKVPNEYVSYCGMEDHAIQPLFVTFAVFGYIVPLVVICGVYIVIVNHLYMASASTVGQTRQRTARASKVIIVVVIVFTLFWLPLHVNQLLGLFGQIPKSKWYEVFRVFAQCMAYGNSCANPIIYNYVSKDFKRGFYEVMCCRTRTHVRLRNGTTNTDNGLTTERTAMV